jgi:glutamine amidotransferase
VIAIIDYKAGNLASVRKALEHLNADAVATDDPDIVINADKLILPGVGHFSATAELSRRGLRRAIQESIAAAKPFLGICVGMQWMFAGSSEAPGIAGLGGVAAICQRFAVNSLKVPHVGWNQITKLCTSRLLNGIDSGTFVYYSHSYCAPITAETVAISDYGTTYSAVIESGSLFGVQFHPEKSGAVGLRLLRNFVEL